MTALSTGMISAGVIRYDLKNQSLGRRRKAMQGFSALWGAKWTKNAKFLK